MSRKNSRVFNPAYSPDADRLYRTVEDRKEANRFYASKAWRELRTWFLRLNPICADCDEPATEVHHLKERRDCADLVEALDPRLLQAVCHRCHLKKRNQNPNE